MIRQAMPYNELAQRMTAKLAEKSNRCPQCLEMGGGEKLTAVIRCKRCGLDTFDFLASECTHEYIGELDHAK